MVKISNFVYCMNAVTNEKESNIFGVLNAINPDYVPGAFSFSIFCSILGLENGAHKLAMKFISPSGKELVNINGDLSYNYDNSQGIPEEYSGVNIGSTWQNVLLEESGLYKTDVYIDEGHCGSYEIYIEGKNRVKS